MSYLLGSQAPTSNKLINVTPNTWFYYQVKIWMSEIFIFNMPIYTMMGLKDFRQK